MNKAKHRTKGAFGKMKEQPINNTTRAERKEKREQQQRKSNET